MKIVMTLILWSIASVTLAQPPSPTSTRVMYPVVVHEFHDADTIKVTVKFPWNIQLGPEWIRTSSYDAWEIDRTRKTVTITEEELAKGRAAKEAIEKLFAENKVYIAPLKAQGTRDVYGRLLADFYLVGKDGAIIDVAEWMKKNGHDRGPVK